jgi:uncharacterized membrane protein/protein-disulfide isomerase
MAPAIKPPSFIRILMVALMVAALGVNIYLLTRTLGDAAIAGCGGGPCDEVLASRWSSLLGLPIPAFGILVYTLLLLSFFRRLEFLRLPSLGGIAGAAVWFVAVQTFIFGKFCPWCMTAHGIGLAVVLCGILSGYPAAWRLVPAWAGLAVFAVATMQVLGPVKSGHRIEGVPAAPVAKRRGASISFNDGKFIYQLAEHPRIGPADAERVLVEFFDYQCPACQTMVGYLEALVAAHAGRVAVLLMPVPLEHDCNPHLGANRAREGSCAIARIALAVWRKRPGDFPDFHRKLIAAPSESAARMLALELMDERSLTAALADPWIDQTIASHTAAWAGLSSSSDKLPKLLIRDKRILHGLPSGESDFLRVMKQELGF